MAELSILQSKTNSCTVGDLLACNKLARRVREEGHTKIIIHHFDKKEEIVIVGWGDAAHANRPDGSSTEGRVIGTTVSRFLKGDECGVSMVSWRSSKIDRTCRSPPAAEALATVNLEDELTGYPICTQSSAGTRHAAGTHGVR